MRVPLNLLRTRRGGAEPPSGDDARSQSASVAESAQKPALRRKLRLRYTLRALLVVITLFMIWGGYHTDRGWRERKAVAVLEAHYAQIIETPSPWYWPPGWYRRLVAALWGDRCIWHVNMNPELTPAEVDALVALPSLERLSLHPRSRNGPEEPKFEDMRPVALPSGALPRILAAHSIWELWLDGCSLSDDDYRAIAEEESLTFLVLVGPSLSDRNLGPILSLPRLKSLQLTGPLDGAPATGKGLLNHSGSGSLDYFRSTDVPLGDEFASFLAKCPNLRQAGIRGANVSVEFTRQLENHPSLEVFGIAGGGVTEVSIDSLLTIPRLSRLGLPQRILTPEAEATISQRRPDVSVVASGY